MSVEKLNDELEFAASQGPDVAVMTTQETVRAVLAEVGMVYVLPDGCHVTGERAVDLYDDELERCRKVSSELADCRAELDSALRAVTSLAAERNAARERVRVLEEALRNIKQTAWPISDPLEVQGGTVHCLKVRIEELRLMAATALATPERKEGSG